MATENDGSLKFDTGLDTDGFKKGSEKLIKAMESLSAKLDQMGENMRQAYTTAAQTIQTTAAATEEATSASSRAATASDQAAKATSRYEKELARVEKQLQAAEAKLSDYNNEVAEIQARTDEWMKSSVNGGEEIDRMLEMEQLEIDQVNQKYATQIARVNELKAEQAQLREAIAQAAAQQQAAAVAEEQQAMAEQAHAAAARQTRTEQTAAAQEAQQQNQVLIDQNNQLAQTHTSAFQTMIGNLKTYAAEAKATAIANNRLVRTLTSLKTMLVARVKRMFISAIMSNVGDSLASLRKYSASFNAAMTRMTNAAHRAGGNIAIAVMHLVMTAEPYITRLLNLLNKAIERLNKFFALLRGVKNVTYDDIADLGTEIEEAAEAQKELNAELYGFDELNKQGDNGDGVASTTPGGGGIAPPEDVQEETTSWLDGLLGKLGDIGKIVAGIAAGFAAWKLGKGLVEFLDPTGAKGLRSRLIGVALAIGGATTATLSFIDAWKNGLSGMNLAGFFGGGAVAAAGLALACKNLKAGMIGLAVTGIGGVVLGAREWIKTGELTQKSFLSIEGGLLSLGIGLAKFTGGWSLLVAGVAMAGLAIYKYWDQIKAACVTGFEAVKTGLIAAKDWVVAGVTEFIGELKILGQGMWTMLTEIWNWIWTGLQTAWTWITTGIQTLVTNIQLLWQQLLLSTQQLWTMLSTFFIQTWESMKMWATSAVTTIKDWVVNAWNVVQATTVSVYTHVKTFIQTTWNTIKTTMVSVVTSAKNAVVAQWNALLASCKAIFNGVHTTIVTLIQQAASFLAGQSWYGYGVQLMQGFWNGLRSLMSAIWQSVVDFVHRCAEAVRNALRIGSPSKVFEQIGEYTGEGFIIGLEDQEATAIKTAENLANAVTDGMSGTIGNVDVTASGMNAVISKLGTVAQIFTTIAQALSSIGGLAQPQISSGSVVPYRARVNSSEGGEEAGGAVATALNEILTALRTMTAQNSGSGGPSENHYHIIADGKEIFDLVVMENDRAINRTGASPLRV